MKIGRTPNCISILKDKYKSRIAAWSQVMINAITADA